MPLSDGEPQSIRYEHIDSPRDLYAMVPLSLRAQIPDSAISQGDILELLILGTATTKAEALRPKHFLTDLILDGPGDLPQEAEDQTQLADVALALGLVHPPSKNGFFTINTDTQTHLRRIYKVKPSMVNLSASSPFELKGALITLKGEDSNEDVYSALASRLYYRFMGFNTVKAPMFWDEFNWKGYPKLFVDMPPSGQTKEYPQLPVLINSETKPQEFRNIVATLLNPEDHATLGSSAVERVMQAILLAPYCHPPFTPTLEDLGTRDFDQPFTFQAFSYIACHYENLPPPSAIEIATLLKICVRSGVLTDVSVNPFLLKITSKELADTLEQIRVKFTDHPNLFSYS